MIAAAVLLVAIAVWVAWIYNGFIKLQQRAHQAWSDIDAQLKRRHDLVPALVETVKGYAGHEKRTLEETVKRRSAAVVMQGSEWDAINRTERENLLARSLRGLFALAEAYPDLKASQRFGDLQQQLADIENDLQHARRYYNAVVRDLNTALSKFPNLLVARFFAFRPREFFELDSPLERQAAVVDLGTAS